MLEKATTERSRIGIREELQSRRSTEPDTSGDNRTKERSSLANRARMRCCQESIPGKKAQVQIQRR